MVQNAVKSNVKKFPSVRPVSVAEMVESCLGCKWTLHILVQIRKGVCRPGELSRSAEGLTAKVLNERLRKLVRFGVLGRRSYPQIPPRVEYAFTPLDRRFIRVLDEIDRLQRELSVADHNEMKDRPKVVSQ